MLGTRFRLFSVEEVLLPCNQCQGEVFSVQFRGGKFETPDQKDDKASVTASARCGGEKLSTRPYPRVSEYGFLISLFKNAVEKQL